MVLANDMACYLRNVASNGDPNNISTSTCCKDSDCQQAYWDAFDLKAKPVMVLGIAAPTESGSRVVRQFRSRFCEFWDTIPDKYVPIN